MTINSGDESDTKDSDDKIASNSSSYSSYSSSDDDDDKLLKQTSSGKKRLHNNNNNNVDIIKHPKLMKMFNGIIDRLNTIESDRRQDREDMMSFINMYTGDITSKTTGDKTINNHLHQNLLNY